MSGRGDKGRAVHAEGGGGVRKCAIGDLGGWVALGLTHRRRVSAEIKIEAFGMCSIWKWRGPRRRGWKRCRLGVEVMKSQNA